MASHGSSASVGIVATPENRRTTHTCHNQSSLSYRGTCATTRENVYHSPLLSIWLSSVAHVGPAEEADVAARTLSAHRSMEWFECSASDSGHGRDVDA